MFRKLVGCGLMLSCVAFTACGGDDDDPVQATGGAGGTGGTGGDAGVGGTGGDAGMGGSAGTGIPLEDLPGLLATVYCDIVEQCSGVAYDLFLPGMDCETRLTRQFEDGFLKAVEQGVSDGTVVYNAENIQACLDAFTAQGCDMFTNRGPSICEDAIDGTVADGGDCTATDQCAGPLFCKIDAACPGTCTARQAAGAACEDEDACEDGLVCDDDLGTCAPPGEIGVSCDQGEPECRFGLVCRGGDATTPGTCQSLDDLMTAALDAPCDLDNGPWCQPDLSCVADTAGPPAVFKCAAAAASGAACKFAVPNHCPDTEYCDADIGTGQVDGTCTALPTTGQPCVTVPGAQPCAPYHVCVQDVCQEIQRLDSACTVDEMCYSEHCATAVCEPPDRCAN